MHTETHTTIRARARSATMSRSNSTKTDCVFYSISNAGDTGTVFLVRQPPDFDAQVAVMSCTGELELNDVSEPRRAPDGCAR